MDCLEFQTRLDDLLEGRLGAPDRREAAEHLRRCVSCRELERAARSEPEAAAVEAPPGLAAAILERTSGRGCARARETLCDWVDRRLGEVDAELVRMHLAGCPDCEGLAGALARLSVDLPAMAEREPDARFVDDVLAATLPARRRERAGAARPGGGLTERLSEAWWRLVERPRLAWEGAYVGTLVFLLLFGAPFSPLAGLPERALELVRSNPVRDLAGPASRIEARVSASVRSAWRASGGRALDASRDLASGVGRRYEQTEPSRTGLRRHRQEMLAAARQGDLNGCAEAAREARSDLGAFWEQLTTEEGRPHGGQETTHTPAQGDVP